MSKKVPSVRWLAWLKPIALGCLGVASHSLAAQPTEDWVKAYCQPAQNWPAAIQVEGLAVEEVGTIRPLQKQAKASVSTSKAELGKQLFFDPRLSASNQIACASCHDPQSGWADSKRRSFGHDRQQGQRNSMSLLNVAFGERFFWDGRAQTLHHQALMPIQDPTEMHATLEATLTKLNGIQGYQSQFAALYGQPSEKYTISAGHLADALTEFQRTLVAKRTRFDRFVEGDCQQMNNREVHGLHLFRTKARCITCHQGAVFSDNQFHHTGLSYYGRKHEDLGLYDTTGKALDKGKFKTPGLRELAYTRPYMHNGFFPTLRGVLNMYNAGMTFNKKLKPGEPGLSPLIQPLHLTSSELQDLEAFLLTLSSRTSRYVAPPKLPKN